MKFVMTSEVGDCRTVCLQALASDVTSPVSAFYKGESQEKKLPGDWKEQRFLPGSPAHVMLGGSWGFLFSQSHVVVVTTPSVSDATSSTVGKIANHGSIRGSRPIAFSGCPRGHIVNQEMVGARSTVSTSRAYGYSPSNQSARRTDRSPPDMNPAR